MNWPTIIQTTAVVLIVVMLPYVLGPVLAKSTVRYFSDFRFYILDDGSILPEAEEWWAISDPAMEALGFQAGPLLQVQLSPNVSIVFKVYALSADKDLAMAAAIYRSHQGRAVLAGRYVEFFSEFGADGSVITNNSTMIGYEPTSPDRTIVRTPRIRDLRTLYNLHKEACRRFGYGPKRPVPAGEWWIVSLRESLEKFVRRMCEAGLMRGTGAGDGVLTWKGALLSTWSSLPPWKQIRRARMDAIVEELTRAGRV